MNAPARIACPRCGANCMPGQDRCWQCGGSLPPPEAVLGTPSVPRGQGRRGAPWLLLIPVVAVAILVLGLFAAARLRQRQGGPDSDIRSLSAEIEALRAGRPAAARPEEPLSPEAEEARRTIERLQRQHGLAPPAADPEGRVHLRSGGTMSAEEWQRYRDALAAPR